MRVQPSVKKICRNCKIIRRNRVVRVICTDPRHKQRQGAETFNQGVDALGLIAVVVGKENKRTHKRRIFWDKF